MQTHAPAPLQNQRRHWPVVLACVLALAAVPPGLWLYRDWAERRAVEDVLAELDRTDPGWRFEDIQAARPVYPPEKNSARQVLRVLELLGKRNFEVTQAEIDLFENLSPAAALDDRQISLLRRRLGGATLPALAEAYKLRDMPHGRHPIAYREDYITTILEPLQQARGVCDLLHFDALLRIQEGDEAGALRACACMLNVARSMDVEPCLLGLLVRIACAEAATADLERVLAQGQPDEAGLKDLQSRLERERGESLWRPTLRGERAGLDRVVRLFQQGKIKTAHLTGLPWNSGQQSEITRLMEDFMPVGPRVSRAEFLRLHTRIVATAGLPDEQQLPAFAALQREARSRGGVLELLVPDLTKFAGRHLQYQAHLRSAVVGLAAERYRLKHGHWPETLELLVRDGYLADVPSDPFDGQPLRWKRRPDGAAVYSIGHDQADNGGVLDRRRVLQPGVDAGFRLWDVRRKG